ncbi:MAG: outer membrane protein assembly factor BamD [Candidatus Babeliaceae bacterium]|jgi:outer membrane assembly lipoprotein YfiO
MLSHKLYIFLCISIIITSGCLKKTSQDTPKKNIKDMNIEEAQHARDYYQKTGHPDLVARALERIITLSSDHAISADALIKLADIQLEMNKYEEAQKNYKEFKTLYPGNILIAHAAYKELLAHQKEIKPVYRDQQKTREVIDLAELFLEEFPDDHKKDEVIGILDECYKLLLEHDIMIVQFYITKYHLENNIKSLISAIKRLEYVKKRIIPHISNKQPYESAISTINAMLDTYDAQNPTQQLHTVVELVEKSLAQLFEKIYGPPTITTYLSSQL